MSQSLPEHHEESPVTPGAEPTGHPDVDAVVASLDGLGDAPVSDHVTVFERAHDSLRRALDDAGDGTPARS